MRTRHRSTSQGPALASPAPASPAPAGRSPRGRHARARGLAAAAGLAAGTLGIAGAPAASAAAPADAIVPVGPHQTFLGDVNGVSAAAVIKVGCFGPVTPTSTGHPLDGQTVAVHLVADDPTKTAGYTGESANRIVVQFEDSGPVVGLPVSLSGYGVKAAVPTSLELPCYGPGKVNFVPSPTSSTARTATVAVTYESVGV
jgi:hypothetical protein